MNEKISIIVPVYNVPQNSLEKCIDSLINQSYKNIEIIIVDDGSSNDISSLCDSYKEKDNRIIVIHQENQGLCSARNTGFYHSSGDWITFVDGDDWIELDGLERINKKITSDSEVVCFGTIKEYKKSFFLYDFNDLFDDCKMYDSQFFLKKLFDFESNISDVTAKLYKKNFLQKNKIIHDVNIKQGVESFDYNFEVFSRAKKVFFIKEYIYHYTFNENSITMKQNSESINILLDGLTKMEKKVLTLKNSEITKSFYRRVNYINVTTLISGFFNPNIKENFATRKEKAKEFLNKKIILEALKNKYNIDFKRNLILFFATHNMYIMVYFFAILRNFQKKN